MYPLQQKPVVINTFYNVLAMVINKMRKHNDEIYEGRIIMFVECINPEQDQYETGTLIEDNNILEKNGLKPGDEVKYKIVESEINIDRAEILTSKNI
jgi:hypothetical protein